MSDVLIVGAGFSGATCARIMAENGFNVTVIDKRSSLGGNMYDYINKYGILIHQYGPHILYLHNREIFEFLSRFTLLQKYEHHVKGLVDAKQIFLPVNLNSLYELFPNDFSHIKQALIQKYGLGSQIPILNLLDDEDPLIRFIAKYIYERIFLHYTMKMWGMSPREIDPAVTARIPLRVSYDNRHFLHPYQVMPKDGYTSLFKNMFRHPRIRVELNCASQRWFEVNRYEKNIMFKREFDGFVIYTGCIDRLFDFCYGELEYRSLDFHIETFEQDYIQDVTTLNFPDDRPATRRTEMKRLTGQIVSGFTTTITEYPGNYERDTGWFGEPYYPIPNEKNQNKYQKYCALSKEIPKLFLVGRLAEYRYYNMEQAISASLKLCKKILNA